jgi:hypothetical protein
MRSLATAESAGLLRHIREVPGSNLGPDDFFLRLTYRSLSQSPQKNVRLGEPHCVTALFLPHRAQFVIIR